MDTRKPPLLTYCLAMLGVIVIGLLTHVGLIVVGQYVWRFFAGL